MSGPLFVTAEVNNRGSLVNFATIPSRTTRMDLTRRTLEEEFGTSAQGNTPQQDSSVIIAQSSLRKRRLSHISLGDGTISIGSATRKMSAVTPNSFITSTEKVKSPLTTDALVRENSRLKFELETAKALQDVLESNIRTMREQIVMQKSVSAPSYKDDGYKSPDSMDARKKHDAATLQSSDDIAALKALLEERQSEIISTKSVLEDQIANLQNALSLIEDEKTTILKENESLRAKFFEIQDACTACHAECQALKESLAQREDASLKRDMQPIVADSEIFRNDLEVKLLQEQLERVQADASNNVASIMLKLEEAQSKIRRLEMLTQSQDENHLRLLQAQDEIARWKSLFSYIDKDITPQVLFDHMREMERKLFEFEKSKMSSPKISTSEKKMEILENNVRSLGDENLHLRKKLKELSTVRLSEDQETKYQQQINSLNDKVSELREKLGSGHFNSETTKVLHMKKNPFHNQKVDSLQARITSLDAENSSLRSRLEAFDSGPDGGTTAQSELKMAQMQGEISLLQKKLTDVQKGSERLKQVFTRQIAMLRESIPKIFGYHLEMVSDPASRETKAIFTLHPQGSDSNSKVIFKLLIDGSVSLVENEFTKRFSKEIETFINKFNSIPGFIANMTLENFQNQGD